MRAGIAVSTAVTSTTVTTSMIWSSRSMRGLLRAESPSVPPAWEVSRVWAVMTVTSVATVIATLAPASRLRRGTAGEQGGHLDVLDLGHLVHQVEGLEHEPDLASAQTGERPLAQRVDAAPGDGHLAAGGAFQTAEQVQERGFAASARVHDGERLVGRAIEVDAVKCANQARRLAVRLAQPPGAEQGRSRRGA